MNIDMNVGWVLIVIFGMSLFVGIVVYMDDTQWSNTGNRKKLNDHQLK